MTQKGEKRRHFFAPFFWPFFARNAGGEMGLEGNFVGKFWVSGHIYI